MKYIATLALALVLVLGGCSKGDAQAGNGSQKNVQTQTAVSSDETAELGLLPADKAPVAPDWELQTVDGGTVKLSSFQGKVVILDFWDTWCPPCKAEIPDFIKLYDQYRDKGLVIVGAAFGNNGPDAVKEFVQEWKMNYPVVFVTPEVNRLYGGIQSIPTTFIIDSEGRARAMHVGFAEKEVFEREIKALLPNG
jgi:thiol-disulfide isomerase/thioredoxin